MRTDVLLPQVELTMESAVIARWLVAVGDRVAAEQPLLEVETQKATTDVPSPAAGYVRQLCVREGETVGGKALLCILTDGPDEPVSDGSAASARGSVASAPAIAQLERGERSAATSGPVKASPAARRLARERGIDLSKVTGTGPDGRVNESDVLAAAATAPATAPIAESSTEWTTLPRTRVALIEQMQRSLREIPQIHLRRQFDVTPLCAPGQGVTFTHRLVFAIALALRAHPPLRTSIDGNKVKVQPVNVAVAIESPHGLVAPVIRNVDELSLEQVSATVENFRERAQANALRRDELVGDAPFAISNLGMLEVDQFDAFVFHGQTAVLSVGKAMEGPSGGAKLAWVGLAVDHRVVDGAEAARFLQTLQREIHRR